MDKKNSAGFVFISLARFVLTVNADYYLIMTPSKANDITQMGDVFHLEGAVTRMSPSGTFPPDAKVGSYATGGEGAVRNQRIG